jgi:type 1 glutamine amidotransferase
VRVQVGPDYRDVDAIAASDLLVTYTCNVRPTEAQQDALAGFVAGGGRWLALHGTNAALDFTPAGVDSPRVFPRLVDVLGSQFIAHPPIAPYTVAPVAPGHPLVAGIPPFETTDELYLSEEREGLVPLLATRWGGAAPGFVEAEWPEERDHLCAYLRPYGEGCVYYITLGHCRGHYDMQPQVPWYPVVERGSWERPELLELLRRGLRWAAEAAQGVDRAAATA